jgi:hypothetical protein
MSERARAVGIALVDGVPAAAAATGIPDRTIYEWQESPEFAELRERTKEQVADEWWAIVQQGFRKTAELLGGTTDAQRAATATAIIADKMLLIRGEATSRTESRSLSDVLDDHERATLRSLIVGELADREAGSSDQGVGVDTGAAPVTT